MDIDNYLAKFDQAVSRDSVLGPLVVQTYGAREQTVMISSEIPDDLQRECSHIRTLMNSALESGNGDPEGEKKLSLRALQVRGRSSDQKLKLYAAFSDGTQRTERARRRELPDGAIELEMSFETNGRLAYVWPTIKPTPFEAMFSHSGFSNSHEVRRSGPKQKFRMTNAMDQSGWEIMFKANSHSKEISLLEVPGCLDEKDPKNLVSVFKAEALKILEQMGQKSAGGINSTPF